ncbi:MAG: hypothetical protein HW400_813 [Candidatus Levybacteria bacterium]|nr:hypothetical protein [Candidatus Levybacteria bacterium]
MFKEIRATTVGGLGGTNIPTEPSTLKLTGEMVSIQGSIAGVSPELRERNKVWEEYQALVFLNASSRESPMAYKLLATEIPGDTTEIRVKYARDALRRVGEKYKDLEGVIEEDLMVRDPENPLGRQAKVFWVEEENKQVVWEALEKLKTSSREDQEKPIKAGAPAPIPVNEYTKSDVQWRSGTGKMPSSSKVNFKEKGSTSKDYELVIDSINFFARSLLAQFANFALKKFEIILTEGQIGQIKKIKNESDWMRDKEVFKSSENIINGFMKLRNGLKGLIGEDRAKFKRQNSIKNKNIVPMLEILNNVKTHEKLDELMIELCNTCLRDIGSPEISLEKFRGEKGV